MNAFSKIFGIFSKTYIKRFASMLSFLSLPRKRVRKHAFSSLSLACDAAATQALSIVDFWRYRVRRRLQALLECICELSNDDSLFFRPSTLRRRTSVFENLYFGKTFSKILPFWCHRPSFSIALVWTECKNK